MRLAAIFVLFSSLYASAQETFWDAQRKIETGIYLSAISLDGWATQNGIHQGGFVERNPFARPFVSHGVAGQVAASGLGLMAGVGPSYLLYKAGHHKLSRIWLHVFTVGESVNSVQMAWLVTHHR